MPLLSGDKIESYELVSICGWGAFGQVWVANDALKRQVALKIINKFSRAKDELKGLMTYFEMPPNPYLISVYHIGETADFYYYTMELADNASDEPGTYIPMTLEKLLQQRGTFSVTATIELGNKLLTGVSALHKAGLVHRDLKPSNVIFVHGEPKISDVGLIFKANVPATLIGTLGYITPERLTSSSKIAYTAADDLYALGKILYCTWTGNSSEEYPSLPAKCFASLEDATLNEVIKRACNNSPDRRFREAEAFLKTLNEPPKSTDVSSSGRGTGGMEDDARVSLRRRRRRLAVWVTALVLLFAGGAVAVHYACRRSAGHPRDYLVIDVSSGAASTSYPVRWSSEPPDLSSDVCRTDEVWLKRIPAGTFMMGSPEDEPHRNENERQHKVDIQHDFYMGIFEVTQMQFVNVLGTHFSRVMGDTRPVEWVSYNLIRKSEKGWPEDGHHVTIDSFFKRLQERTGLLFDLPCEAEWEYACRAGTTGPLYIGVEENADEEVMARNLGLIARYSGNRRIEQPGGFREHTRVGSYLPNAWGLYDMQGNVWEYCLDWYEPQPQAEPGLTPKGPASSLVNERVMRGGDWLSRQHECRAALRRHVDYSRGYNTGGFRIAYPSDQPEITLK